MGLAGVFPEVAERMSISWKRNKRTKTETVYEPLIMPIKRES